MSSTNPNSDDGLWPNERELLNDETFWRIYREMYRRCRSLPIVRYQVSHDLGPAGAPEVVGLNDGVEWDSLSDEDVAEVAKWLVDATVNSVNDEFREAYHDWISVEGHFTPQIEERVAAIPEESDAE